MKRGGWLWVLGAAWLIVAAAGVFVNVGGQELDEFGFVPVVLAPEATPTMTLTPTVPPTPLGTATATATATTAPQSTATATSTTAPQPTATSTTQPPGGCSICSYDAYNCSDFSTQAEAQACFNYCWAQVGYDVHQLDADDNGVACESLPRVFGGWVFKWR